LESYGKEQKACQVEKNKTLFNPIDLLIAGKSGKNGDGE
jgi:hypothetical protein